MYPNINSYRLSEFQTPRIGGHDEFAVVMLRNACEELDHLIILYPPVPCTHEYWGDPPITMVAPPLDIAIIFPIFGACFTCTIDHFKL